MKNGRNPTAAALTAACIGPTTNPPKLAVLDHLGQRHKPCLVGVLALTLASMGSASADVLFDNGAFSGTQEQRNNACNTIGTDGCERAFTIYEDFTLDSKSVITGIEWSQHEFSPSSYLRTNFSLYNDIPSDSSLLLRMSVIASRSLNNTPMLGSDVGVDNVISGLSIELEAGTYWFGINNDVSDGVTNWDQTTGTASTIPGRLQGIDAPGNLPGNIPGPDGSSMQFHPNENSVFRIVSNLIIVSIDIKTRINL